MKLIQGIRLFIIVFILSSVLASSQKYTSLGKEFWLGFMENYPSQNNPISLYIYVSSSKNTSGVVEIPLVNYSYNFNVNANSTLRIQIPTNLAMSTESEQPEKKAIHILTDDPVTVYALNYAYRTSDAALILPIQTLGTKYFVQSYNTNDNVESLLQIIPAGEETVIRITPTQRTKLNKPPNVPFEVTLKRGESYQIKSQNEGDLTGTKIEVIQGEPIAVFGGAKCSFVGNCNCCCDHLFDQMFPVNETGMREFITVPYQTRIGDLFRIISFYDNTRIIINDVPLKVMNEGEVYETVIFEPSHIQSDKPISVGHYSRSRECDGNMDSDPFYINLSSTDMNLDTITFNAFDSDEIENYFVNIVSATNRVNDVFYDGVNIGNLFEPVLAKPEFSFAQISTRAGDHTLISEGGVIAYVYGYGVRESYGYSAGINLLGKFEIFNCQPKTYLAGDTVTYVIQISETSFIETIGEHEYSAQLRFNPNILLPLVDSTLNYENDGSLTIEGTKFNLRPNEVLKELKFKALLGDSVCTTIYLDSLSWDDFSYGINSECEVCIEVCEEGGTRLILSTDTVSISNVIPNPVSNDFELEFTVIEKGETFMYLADELGHIVVDIHKGTIKPGTYNTIIKTAHLSSGMYVATLITPSIRLTKQIYIIK